MHHNIDVTMFQTASTAKNNNNKNNNNHNKKQLGHHIGPTGWATFDSQVPLICKHQVMWIWQLAVKVAVTNPSVLFVLRFQNHSQHLDLSAGYHPFTSGEYAYVVLCTTQGCFYGMEMNAALLCIQLRKCMPCCQFCAVNRALGSLQKDVDLNVSTGKTIRLP